VPKDVIKPALPAQAHAPIAIHFAYPVGAKAGLGHKHDGEYLIIGLFSPKTG
jgi:hypothetical protein